MALSKHDAEQLVAELQARGDFQQVGVNAEGEAEYATTAKLMVKLVMGIVALKQEKANEEQRDYSGKERCDILEKLESTRHILIERLPSEKQNITGKQIQQLTRRTLIPPQRMTSVKRMVEEAMQNCAQVTLIGADFSILAPAFAVPGADQATIHEPEPAAKDACDGHGCPDSEPVLPHIP